jgi:hypothetical protein
MPPEQGQQAGLIDGLRSYVKKNDVPAASDLARRQSRVDGAIDQAAPPDVAPPAQMTPQQLSDWQAVGTGLMKLNEFQRKHGFIPN